MPELAGEEIRDALAASVDSNVRLVAEMLRSGVDPAEATPPPAAVEYARELVRRGMSIDLLLRAYFVGHAAFLRHWIDRVHEEVERSGRAGRLDRGGVDLDIRLRAGADARDRRALHGRARALGAQRGGGEGGGRAGAAGGRANRHRERVGAAALRAGPRAPGLPGVGGGRRRRPGGAGPGDARAGGERALGRTRNGRAAARGARGPTMVAGWIGTRDGFDAASLRSRLRAPGRYADLPRACARSGPRAPA